MLAPSISNCGGRSIKSEREFVREFFKNETGKIKTACSIRQESFIQGTNYPSCENNKTQMDRGHICLSEWLSSPEGSWVHSVPPAHPFPDLPPKAKLVFPLLPMLPFRLPLPLPPLFFCLQKILKVHIGWVQMALYVSPLPAGWRSASAQSLTSWPGRSTPPWANATSHCPESTMQTSLSGGSGRSKTKATFQLLKGDWG